MTRLVLFSGVPEGYDIETLAEMLEEGELNPSDSVSAKKDEKPAEGGPPESPVPDSTGSPVPDSTDKAQEAPGGGDVDLPDPPDQTTDDYRDFEENKAELEQSNGDASEETGGNGKIGDEYVQDDMDMESWKDRVREVIDKLRPFIQYDGGDIEIIEFDRPNVKVKMLGACVGCPSSVATLKHSMEQALRDEVPGFEEVIQVNDLADMA